MHLTEEGGHTQKNGYTHSILHSWCTLVTSQYPALLWHFYCDTDSLFSLGLIIKYLKKRVRVRSRMNVCVACKYQVWVFMYLLSPVVSLFSTPLPSCCIISFYLKLWFGSLCPNHYLRLKQRHRVSAMLAFVSLSHQQQIVWRTANTWV